MKPILINDTITKNTFLLDVPNDLAERLYKLDCFIEVYTDYERDYHYLILESVHSDRRAAAEVPETLFVEALYELTSKMEATK